MAFAETANLVARLTLKDEFSKPLAGIQGKLNGLGSAASRTGKVLAVGLGAGLAVGGAVLTRAISGGLHSLADLESATTSVDAAIKQMGLTGQVTSGQIHDWANQIEKDVGAAFDDKAITQAATTLIRYGHVTTANLRPALVVMTDLAAKTGDVDSAASLLAKALADPEKAAGRLARQGVILTKVEQAQIKALVKAGKVGQAQKLVLDAITKSTKGAAAASQGPYTRSLKTLHDVIEDAQRALAEGFLPVIEKVRDILSTELAKPQTLNNIREFGKGLASGLGHLIEIARGLPWGAIGDALKIGGAGAKIILDAFTSMPPWVQTAIATGWGLNKLTGGALTGLIGQLASGLVKGVLGINAGVVHLTAGTVVGGPGGVAGAAKTGISTLGKLFLVGETIGLVVAVNEVRDSIATGLTKQSTDIQTAVSNQINSANTTTAQLAQSLAGINQGIEKLSHDPIGNALLGDQLGELQKMRAALEAALEDRVGLPGDANQREDRNLTLTQQPLLDGLRALGDKVGGVSKSTADSGQLLYDVIAEAASTINATLGRTSGNIIAAIHGSAFAGPSGMVWKPSDKIQVEDRRTSPLLEAQQLALLRIKERADSNALQLKTGITEVRDESARAKIAAAGNAQMIRNAETSGTAQIVGAIRTNRPIVRVNVSTYVSTGAIAKATKISKTYSSGHTGGFQEYG